MKKNLFLFEIGEFDIDLYGVIRTFKKNFETMERANEFCKKYTNESSKYLILHSEKQE